MTETSLLYGKENTTDHLKASGGGLDELALTTLITELIHHSLCAMKSGSVSADSSSLEVVKDEVVNWKPKCCEKLINLSVVVVVLGLVNVTLQRSA